jgi:hypothetical protein
MASSPPHVQSPTHSTLEPVAQGYSPQTQFTDASGLQVNQDGLTEHYNKPLDVSRNSQYAENIPDGNLQFGGFPNNQAYPAGSGYIAPGYPPQGYPPQFPQQGYPQQGYPPQPSPQGYPQAYAQNQQQQFNGSYEPKIPGPAAIAVPVSAAENGPNGSTPKRKILGLPVVAFWILVVILILAIIGGVVGGVVGGMKAKQNSDNASSQAQNGGVIGDTSSSSSSITIAPTPASTSDSSSSIAATSTSASTSASTSTSTTSSASRPTSTSINTLFSSTKWYRLSNKYLTTDYALDILSESNALNMSLSSNSSQGQSWQFRLSSDGSYYNIATEILGPTTFLTILDSSSIYPRMSPADSSLLGQRWTFTPWNDADGGLWYSITNLANGEDWHLDTYSDTHRLFMRIDPDSGQRWLVTEMGDITDSQWL